LLFKGIYLRGVWLTDAKSGNQLARLNADVKLFWAAGLTIGILFCQSIPVLSILLVLLGLLGLYDSGIASAYRKFVWVGIPAILIIMAIHLFYHKGEVLFNFGAFAATIDGIKEGVLNSLRFLNFGMVAIATLGGIEPVDFGKRIAWGLSLFRWRKLRDLALVFFVAIRFVPSFMREMEMLKMAMRARGADFDGSPINKLRLNMKLLLPLFSRVIRQADDIACAISLKGHRGIYLVGKRPSLGTGDVFLIVMAILLATVLAFV
jgi:energy-coupling factor transport system permease protein